MRIPNHHRLPLLTVVAVGVLAMLAATLLLSWPQVCDSLKNKETSQALGVPTNLTAGSTGQRTHRSFLDSAPSSGAILVTGYMIERSEDGRTGWERAGITGVDWNWTPTVLSRGPSRDMDSDSGVRNHILLPGFGYFYGRRREGAGPRMWPVRPRVAPVVPGAPTGLTADSKEARNG